MSLASKYSSRSWTCKAFCILGTWWEGMSRSPVLPFWWDWYLLGLFISGSPGSDGYCNLTSCTIFTGCGYQHLVYQLEASLQHPFLLRSLEFKNVDWLIPAVKLSCSWSQDIVAVFRWSVRWIMWAGAALGTLGKHQLSVSFTSSCKIHSCFWSSLCSEMFGISGVCCCISQSAEFLKFLLLLHFWKFEKSGIDLLVWSWYFKVLILLSLNCLLSMWKEKKPTPLKGIWFNLVLSVVRPCSKLLITYSDRV